MGCHDVPPEVAAIHNAEAILSNTTKHIFLAAGSGMMLHKIIEMMAAIVGGKDQLAERPIMTCGSCPVTPLRLPRDCCEIVIESSRSGLVTKCLSQGIPVNDETLAVDVIHEIGHSKDYLSHGHTMAHMRTAQTHPDLIDRRMRVDWEAAGGTSIYERSWEKAMDILKNYKPEPLPDDVQKALHSIVQETEEEFGVKKE
jgi:trimethylamine--corrinoid protein Co-methyltransferase